MNKIDCKDLIDNSNKYMTSEEALKLMLLYYPKTFSYWFNECESLWKQAHWLELDYHEPTNEEKLYKHNMAIHFATTILYDFDDEFANRLGKILIAETENK